MHVIANSYYQSTLRLKFASDTQVGTKKLNIISNNKTNLEHESGILRNAPFSDNFLNSSDAGGEKGQALAGKKYA